MSRTVIVVASSGLLLFAGWLFGQAKGGGNNGARWKVLTAFEKNLYALGFVRGYEQGMYEAGASAVMNTGSKNTKPNFTPEQQKEVEGYAAQAREHAEILMTGQAKITEITSTMNTFYSDYRNSAVCWSDALIFSTAALAGHPAGESSLEAARKTGAEKGCPLNLTRLHLSKPGEKE